MLGNSPGANAASVADLAMTLMLAVTRGCCRRTIICAPAAGAAQAVADDAPQPGMPGRRIGVYGMGEIGRKIASAPPHSNPTSAISAAASMTCRIATSPILGALVDWCDVLIVAVRAGPDTHTSSMQRC